MQINEESKNMIFQIVIAAWMALTGIFILMQISSIRNQIWRIIFRVKYRIKSSPKKMEKARMRELEDELQQILAEEREKDEIRSRRAHPAGWRRQDIDNGTKRIISEIAKQAGQENKSKKSDYYSVDPQFSKKNWKWPEPPKRG